MATPNYKNYVEDAAGRDQLRQMIHHHRHGAEDLVVPPRVRREVALEVLVLEVTPALGAEEMERAADVARFYVLPPALKNFSALLRRKEQTVLDLVRSVECLRVMGDLGNAEQQTEAAAYFDYLTGHPLFEKVVPQMIECYFHLEAATEQGLASRLENQVQLAKSRLAASPASEEAERDAIMLDEQLHGDLPVFKHAKGFKQKLLTEPDPLKRSTGLARTYLGLDAPGGIDWPKWAGFEIMREVFNAHEQNAVAGLRAALNSVAGESPEFEAQARGRALKAIRFLAGRVDTEEARWLEAGDRTRRFQLQG